MYSPLSKSPSIVLRISDSFALTHSSLSAGEVSPLSVGQWLAFVTPSKNSEEHLCKTLELVLMASTNMVRLELLLAKTSQYLKGHYKIKDTSQ